MVFTCKAEPWLYPGESAWVFITLPSEYTSEIRSVHQGSKRGFGAVKVEVEAGAVRWTTSLFPDSKSGAYLLPLKKAVRVAAHIEIGVETTIKVRILEPVH